MMSLKTLYRTFEDRVFHPLVYLVFTPPVVVWSWWVEYKAQQASRDLRRRQEMLRKREDG